MRRRRPRPSSPPPARPDPPDRLPSSGDLLADRRYAYAEAALKEGDFEAAADLARQVLELAPGFGAAWFLLGEACAERARGAGGAPEAETRQAEAIAAFERALAADPADPQGARVRLAALGVGDPRTAMSPGYLRALFDDYAVRFDRHLTVSLKYRAPALLHDAVRRACSLRLRSFRFERALDLGCGTGLAGEVFRPDCGSLAGIDLSPAMIEKARRKRLYDELAVGDLVGWLREQPAASADLVLAADVLVYLADLRPVFAEVARVLAARGLFAFTAQWHAGEGVVLGQDLRYAHGEPYLHDLACAHGLAPVLLERASTREDRGAPVPGWVGVLSWADQARSVSAKSSPL